MLLCATSAEAQQTTGSASVERELMVGVKEAPPFAMKQPDGSWTGISIDLWNKAAADNGYRYRFVEEPTVPGLLDGAATSRYDVSIGALTITGDRERNVDFTHAYYSTGLALAVPAEGVLSWVPVVRAVTSFGFMQAVLALVGLAFATGFAVWLFEHRQNEGFSGTVAKEPTSSVWWSTLAMTQRSPTGSGPMTLPGRLIAILWMVTSIIALAVFTASVTSVLTTKQLQGAVNGVGDLGSVRVGVPAGTAGAQTLERMGVESAAPSLSVAVIVWPVAACAVLAGILLVGLAFRLRSLARHKQSPNGARAPLKASEETMPSWDQVIVWIIVGLIGGSLAGLIIRWDRRGFGLMRNLAVGLLGALIGGFLFRWLGILPEFDRIAISLRDVVSALAGSLLVLAAVYAWRKLKR